MFVIQVVPYLRKDARYARNTLIMSVMLANSMLYAICNLFFKIAFPYARKHMRNPHCQHYGQLSLW